MDSQQQQQKEAEAPKKAISPNCTVISFFDLDCVNNNENLLPPKLQDLFEEVENNMNVRQVSEGVVGARENV